MGFLYKQIPKFLMIHSTVENDTTHITGTLPGLENDVHGFGPRVKSFPLTAVCMTIELMLVKNSPVTAFILHGLSNPYVILYVTEYLAYLSTSTISRVLIRETVIFLALRRSA
jgi:hypothetical protein